MTTDQLGLFTRPRSRRRRVKAEERNKREQVAAIRQDDHPLAGALNIDLPLHPDAVKVTGPVKPPSPVRCGNCRFRRKLWIARRRRWRCVFDQGRRIKGTASELRLWWPGCWNWCPEEDRAAV